MIASLVYPKLARCVGVELLVDLAVLGQQVTRKMIGTAEYLGVSCASIQVFEGNMFEHDWSSADIIFAASVCFSNEMMETFAD